VALAVWLCEVSDFAVYIFSPTMSGNNIMLAKSETLKSILIQNKVASSDYFCIFAK